MTGFFIPFSINNPSIKLSSALVSTYILYIINKGLDFLASPLLFSIFKITICNLFTIKRNKLMNENPLGRHITTELYGCKPEDLNNLELIKEGMITGAINCGATVLNVSFHEFSPQGVTCLLLLSESHFSFHSWPELGYAAVDCYTCGDTVDPQKAIDHLTSVLNPLVVENSQKNRGNMQKALQFQETFLNI